MKYNHIPFTFLLFSVVLFLFSCAKRETEEIEPDFAYDYFPLELGMTCFYEVDTVFFSSFLSPDTTHTFVREEIVDTLLDNNGELVYRMERSERKNENDPWNIHSVVTLFRNEGQAFRTEDNLRFTKLVFPPSRAERWNGNAAFDPHLVVHSAGESIEMFKNWDYRITELDQPAAVGGLAFEETLTVTMAEDENLIELREAKEQYARGVGLIYREMRILDTQCNICCESDFVACEQLAWEEKAEKGFILRQWITDYR